MKPKIGLPIHKQLIDLAKQNGISLHEIQQESPGKKVCDFHKELWIASALYNPSQQAETFGVHYQTIMSRIHKY